MVVYFSPAQGCLRARSQGKGFTPFFNKTRVYVKLAQNTPKLARELADKGAALLPSLVDRGLSGMEIETVRNQINKVRKIAEQWEASR